jgi:hypothetical protein
LGVWYAVAEFLAPALELVKTGSPFVSGGMAVALLAGVYIRDLRRHYAAEALTRQERYQELKERHDLLAVKCDTVTDRWLKSEQEKAEIIRVLPVSSRKAGDS